MPIYVPDAFRVDDEARLFAHAEAHPFATLITHGEGGVLVSHVPLLIDAPRRALQGHLARPNPQLAHLAAGAEALAIFHGPHAYISPSVYTEHPSVPTWNYVVVHARGPARMTDEAELRSILERTVARFDKTGWRMTEDPDFTSRMFAAIAGFEIEVKAIIGKWKVSQNRPPEDVRRVISWLEAHTNEAHAHVTGELGGGSNEPPDADARALAALMRRWYGDV
jgi:transcriptional regulator